MDPNPHTHALLVEAAVFERLVQAGGELDFTQLSRSRIKLLQAAQMFLVCENEQIRAGGTGSSATDRARILASLNDLRLRHSGHIATWNPSEVTQNFATYLARSNSLVAELRALLTERSSILRQRVMASV